MKRLDLTVLRHHAEAAVKHLRLTVHPGECSPEEVYLQIIQAFLDVTDPTPVNSVNAKALGLEESEESDHTLVEGDNPASLLAVLIARDHTAVNMQVGNPTRGMLLHVLSKETSE